MMRKILCAWGALAVGAALTGPAYSYEAGDLGKTLTSFGAVKAGNADGSIPAWDGGLAKPPAGYKAGQHYLDPYAADKPLFTITAESADKYKDKLSPGTIAMLKAYPTFKLIVYPSHRSFAAPQYIYDSAIQNATKAHLSPDGDNVLDSIHTVPFPLAKTGNEAIWNHILRWRGSQVKDHTLTAAVTEGGQYTEQKIDLKIIFPYDSPDNTPTKLDNYFYAETVSPPRTAGDITLVHNFTDPMVEERQAWTYNPGQRRVRRAPEVSYDNPITAYDSLATSDDFDMFNGATDKYNWKLVGVKEMYIPYNNYQLQDPKYQYSDIIKPLHTNSDMERWELHRVYEVEADLKPTEHHVYAKRVFYEDEDSWMIALADNYDGKGQLWRTLTAYLMDYYDVPLTLANGEEYSDLQARRYAVTGLFSQDPVPVYTGNDLQVSDFTPEALRRGGTH
jgi:hypothetical protein